MKNPRSLFHTVVFLVALIVAIIKYPSIISNVAITVACCAVFFYGPPVLFKKKNK